MTRVVALLAPLCLFVIPWGASASGGYGTVSVDQTQVTDSSIRVTWTPPSNKFAYCGDVNTAHKLCWKEAGSPVDTCAPNPPSPQLLHQSATSFTINGLDADEKYKIKVYTRATKNNKNCKLRKVGTQKQKTRSAPAARVGSLEATNEGPDFVDVRAHWTHPSDFAKIRVCYHRSWFSYSFEAVCRDASQPFTSNTEARGYSGDITPVASQNDAMLSPMGICREYRFVSYGFASGAQTGTFVGELFHPTTPPLFGACKRIIPFNEYVAESLGTDDGDGIGFHYLNHLGLSVALPPNDVGDHDLEPGTVLHAFARAPGNPWLPGEWNAEAASIIGGEDPATGIAPRTGLGMLRMSATGGSVSQVNQIVGPIGPVSPAGDTVASWSVFVNAPTATALGVELAAGSGQTTVGTLTDRTVVTIPFTTDANPETWELVQGSRTLPASTLYLEIQLSSQNGQIPADGVFFDLAIVRIDPGGLLWDLAQLEPGILADAEILAGDGRRLDDDAALLEYLLAERTALFHAWQDDLAANDPGNALTAWLQSSYPATYAALAEEHAFEAPMTAPIGWGLLLVGILAAARRVLRRPSVDEGPASMM